jgi:hypothetical protein
MQVDTSSACCSAVARFWSTPRHSSQSVLQVAAVVGAVAAVLLQLGVDVLAEAAVVEVAVRVAEVAQQELLVERLAEHVEAEQAVVEAHDRVRDARGRLLRRAEYVVADPLAQPRAVLRAVVQVEAAEAVEARLVAELAEVDGEARPLVQFLEAAGGALQLDADLGERLAVELAAWRARTRAASPSGSAGPCRRA